MQPHINKNEFRHLFGYKISMKKSFVNILILANNYLYNEFLSQELKDFVNKYPLKSIYKIKIFSFTDTEKGLEKIKSTDGSKEDNIVFIDYQSYKSEYGGDLYKTIQELGKKKVKVVLMSQCPINEKIIEKYIKNNYIDFIFKDEYTAAICSLHLEQFLENLIVN